MEGLVGSRITRLTYAGRFGGVGWEWRSVTWLIVLVRSGLVVRKLLGLVLFFAFLPYFLGVSIVISRGHGAIEPVFLLLFRSFAFPHFVAFRKFAWCTGGRVFFAHTQQNWGG